MIDADDPRHGTYAGACAHWNDGEPPCGRCLPAARRRRKLNRYLTQRGTPATVPAIGTVRRIQALRALGWSVEEIARHSGVPAKTLRNPSHRGTSVYRSTAEAVAETYERLSMRIPAGGYAERTRREAARRGFPPPLSWDDADLDNPDARPHLPRTRDQKFGRNHVDPITVERVLLGENLPTTTAERREITRRWIASGGSEAALCRRMRWRAGRYREAS